MRWEAAADDTPLDVFVMVDVVLLLLARLDVEAECVMLDEDDVLLPLDDDAEEADDMMEERWCGSLAKFCMKLASEAISSAPAK